MATKEFIGGKFPRTIKEGLKERADGAAMTMQDYLEQVFMRHLEEEDGVKSSRDQVSALIEQELAARGLTRAAVHPPDEDEDELEEEEFEEEDDEDVEEEEYYSVRELGGLKKLLPPLLADELNCAILRAWENARMSIYSFREPKTVSLLEGLSDELIDLTMKPAKYHCYDPYYISVPEDVVEELDPVIIDAVREVGAHPDRERFYNLLSDLLSDRADQLYVEAREITINFDREEWHVLDKMIREINEGGDTIFSDLQQWIKWKLGEHLIESGTGFWGNIRNEKMVNLGKKLKG